MVQLRHFLRDLALTVLGPQSRNTAESPNFNFSVRFRSRRFVRGQVCHEPYFRVHELLRVDGDE